MAFSEETGDRIAWTKIEQMQSNKYKVLAFYVSPNELHGAIVRWTVIEDEGEKDLTFVGCL